MSDFHFVQLIFDSCTGLFVCYIYFYFIWVETLIPSLVVNSSWEAQTQSSTLESFTMLTSPDRLTGRFTWMGERSSLQSHISVFLFLKRKLVYLCRPHGRNCHKDTWKFLNISHLMTANKFFKEWIPTVRCQYRDLYSCISCIVVKVFSQWQNALFIYFFQKAFCLLYWFINLIQFYIA